MLFKEIIAVYCENHTEHIITLCGQNAVFTYVKSGDTYNDGFHGVNTKQYTGNEGSFINLLH
jgi:hypothetical protein